jgi:hypothetical protein
MRPPFEEMSVLSLPGSYQAGTPAKLAVLSPGCSLRLGRGIMAFSVSAKALLVAKALFGAVQVIGSGFTAFNEPTGQLA